MTATATRPPTTGDPRPTGTGTRVPNRPHVSGGDRARRGLLYVTLVALLVVFVFPLVWALSGSLKQRGDIFSTPPTLVPDPATTENYTNSHTLSLHDALPICKTWKRVGWDTSASKERLGSTALVRTLLLR